MSTTNAPPPDIQRLTKFTLVAVQRITWICHAPEGMEEAWRAAARLHKLIPKQTPRHPAWTLTDPDTGQMVGPQTPPPQILAGWRSCAKMECGRSSQEKIGDSARTTSRRTLNMMNKAGWAGGGSAIFSRKVRKEPQRKTSSTPTKEHRPPALGVKA